MKYCVLIILCVGSVTGCSEDSNEQPQPHVWQDQTDMINKAKQVELMMGEAALKQREQIELQTK
jgi:hypothetical protein